MSTTFFILMMIAMLAVLGTLFIGVGGMAKGGTFSKKHGNKLMQARVVLQGLALVLFVLAVLSAKR